MFRPLENVYVIFFRLPLPIASKDIPQKHDHVIFQTFHNTIAYNDVRRFGLMDLTPTQTWPDHRHFKNLDPEPFDRTFDLGLFHKKLTHRQQPIKVALLDQQLIVGVGISMAQ